MIEIKINQDTVQGECKGKPLDNIAEAVILVQEAFRLAKVIADGHYYNSFKTLVFGYFLDGTFDKFANEPPEGSTRISFCSPRFEDSDPMEEGGN